LVCCLGVSSDSSDALLRIAREQEAARHHRNDEYPDEQLAAILPCCCFRQEPARQAYNTLSDYSNRTYPANGCFQQRFGHPTFELFLDLPLETVNVNVNLPPFK
jgi:hypothetical protein